jgi:hypothetical protein
MTSQKARLSGLALNLDRSRALAKEERQSWTESFLHSQC